MAKHNKKIKIDDLEMDSNEEVMFYHWLKEAQTVGLVDSFVYQPRTYRLSEPVMCTKTKYISLKTEPFIRVAIREVTKIGKIVYTPDFDVEFTPLMSRYYPDLLIIEGGPVVIDVKGDFSRGKNNTSGITFGIKQAWVYQSQGVLVQKVKPKHFFCKTWVPTPCRYTRVKKDLVKEFTKPIYCTVDVAVERMVETDRLLRGINI